jgi:hypothetical protein
MSSTPNTSSVRQWQMSDVLSNKEVLDCSIKRYLGVKLAALYTTCDVFLVRSNQLFLQQSAIHLLKVCYLTRRIYMGREAK